MLTALILVRVRAVRALPQFEAGQQQIGALRRLVLLAVDRDVDQFRFSHLATPSIQVVIYRKWAHDTSWRGAAGAKVTLISPNS